MSSVCPSCGTSNPAGSRFCDRCGKALTAQGMVPAPRGGSWVIGSDPSCDVIVASATVSGRHCRLSLVGSSYWIEDLGSTNGTFVDGVRLTAPMAVSRGNQVLLGRQVPMPWPAAPAAAPAPAPINPWPQPTPYAPAPASYGGARGAVMPSFQGEMRFAGFWLRWVANFIDWFVMTIGVFIGVAMFTIATAGLGACLAPLLGAVFGWLYYAVMESSKPQGTLGKMALGLKVVDYEGNRISFGRATGRYFSKIISSIILLIGYMMAGWTEKKQALHDMIAGTYVIKTRS